MSFLFGLYKRGFYDNIATNPMAENYYIITKYLLYFYCSTTVLEFFTLLLHIQAHQRFIMPFQSITLILIKFSSGGDILRNPHPDLKPPTSFLQARTSKTNNLTCLYSTSSWRCTEWYRWQWRRHPILWIARIYFSAPLLAPYYSS